MDNDLALAILKHCFPEADALKIVHKTLEDGESNFLSDINRLIVEHEQNGATGRKHLIMKVPPSIDLLSACDMLNIYNREIFMYEKLIPQINKYLDRSLAPALLYASDSKILVLEDLAARGYESGGKLPLLNLQQSGVILKSIAHFHAASRKLFEENPNILDTFPCPWMNSADLEKFTHFGKMVALELLKKKSEIGLISKVEAVILFLKKDSDVIRSLLDQSKSRLAVLNHGDGRKENFLFKRTSKNDVKVQFIDYQLSFWCTPVYDIIFFLTTSVSTDVIGAHLDDLINGYLDELNMKLKKLECASTYKRADFDEDFKRLRYLLFVFFFYSCGHVSPLSKEQLKDTYIRPEADASYLCDLCLNDETFVNFVCGWIKYFEKSKIFDEL